MDKNMGGRLLQLKQKIDENITRRQELEAELKVLNKQLKDDFKLNSVEEAQEEVKALDVQVDKLEKKIEKELDEIEKELE